MEVLGKMNEKELREFKNGFPKTLDELIDIIKSLTEREHDYGTCVYAMSICADATFRYVSSRLGCSGFQASCADLDFIKRTRHLDDGFSITNYSDALYPQYRYKLTQTLESVLEKNPKHFKEKATKLLKDKHEMTHPNVISHWKYVIGYCSDYLERNPTTEEPCQTGQ